MFTTEDFAAWFAKIDDLSPEQRDKLFEWLREKDRRCRYCDDRLEGNRTCYCAWDD